MPPLRRWCAIAVAAAAIATWSPILRGQSSQTGQWSPVFSMPLVPVHAALMHTGEVVLFDAWEIPGTPSATLWNPTTDTYTPVPNGFAELFCAGHFLAADGRLVTAGGHNGAGVGTQDTTIFDVATRAWTALPNLNYARWYPTLVQLADGRALTLGGAISRPANAAIPEVLSLSGGGWAPRPAAQKDVGEYPSVFQTANGSVFVAGTDPSFTSWLFDVDASTWTSLGRGAAASGTAVMYRPGKVMMAGGGSMGSDPVVPATAVIDLTDPTPTWRQTAPMAHGRAQHNLVLLPDGKVLVVGGASDVSLISTSGVLPAEIWDPETETWSPADTMSRNRMYHSTALLLPDGRVFSGGGGRINPSVTDELNGQFYSPPYLFRGIRPDVTAAPATVSYGAGFELEVAQPSTVARVTFVRASSATHGVNMDQRFFELPFTTTGTGVSAQAPSDPRLAPPGDYLVFVFSQSGAPSVGRFVRLGGAPAPATLQVSDASANEGTATGGTLTFTVSLNGVPQQTASVDYVTQDGSATAAADYTAVSGRLTFPAGTVSRTIAVPILADADVEANETVDIVLSAPSNATITDATGRGTIVNDDVAITPTIAIEPAGVTEGTGFGTPVAAFSVSLDQAAPQSVLVEYRTVAGTATSPADFASTRGTLTFAGGTTRQTIQVPIAPDALIEGPETFTVELFNQVGGTLGTAVATGTILDDDGVPLTATFVVASGTDDVNEDGATFEATGPTAWVGNGGSGAGAYLGLRFSGVTLPAGAAILSAALEVTSASTHWSALSVEIGADATGSSAPFTDTARPSVRVLLPPRVAHTSDVEWLAGTRYVVADVAAIMQSVVQQPSWAPGGALSLILRGTGVAWNRKHVVSADGGSASAPRLVVTYQTGPPPNRPPSGLNVNATPTTGVAPLAVTLSGSATDPDGHALFYAWTFGDGQTGAGATVTHSYAAAGTYTARLTVSDGAATVTSHDLTIVVASPPEPGDPRVPRDLTVRVAGNSATFSWMAPRDAVTLDAYLFEAGYAPGTPAFVFPLARQTSFAARAPDGIYYVRVRAQHTNGVSAPSNEVVVALGQSAPPLAPRSLQARVQGTLVTLDWQHGPDGPTAARFEVRAGHAAGVANVGTVPLPGAARTFAVRAPPGTYAVWVVAMNASGASPPSNVVVVAPGVCAAPRSPENLRAEVSAAGVLVTWSPPPTGVPSRGYRLIVGSAPGASDVAVIGVAGPSFASPAPPGTYYLRVVAESECGVSPPSAEVTVPVS